MSESVSVKIADVDYMIRECRARPGVEALVTLVPYAKIIFPLFQKYRQDREDGASVNLLQIGSELMEGLTPIAAQAPDDFFRFVSKLSGISEEVLNSDDVTFGNLVEIMTAVAKTNDLGRFLSTAAEM